MASIEHELFIAVVGAIGTDLDLVCRSLCESLSDVNYCSREIRLSELLHEIDRWETLTETPLDKRILAHMDAGDAFRKTYGREDGKGDALSLAAVGAIVKERSAIRSETTQQNERYQGIGYILRSLKHPDEVLTLRDIYGPSFILIAAYSPRETRLQSLAGKIGDSKHDHLSDFRPEAQELIRRDEADVEQEFGQNVQKTFPLADIFVNASDTERLQESIQRFVHILFGYPFHTPTRDEYGMFHAQATALRSASLSRQVGAVIATKEGDIISAGMNEVPKAGGGLYWSDDKPDQRDFKWGFDTSNKIRRNILVDTLKRLDKAGWLKENFSKKEPSWLLDATLIPPSDKVPALMDGAQLMNITEYGRAVHAEMAALLDAACRGVAVKSHALYTTTFPCHDCARHIIAAGISRVVYIEPYPKSLAEEFHGDAIVVDKPGEASNRVSFEPFVGISPRRYMDVFQMLKRKDDSGNATVWNATSAKPRFESFPVSYLRKETDELATFYKKLEAKGLKLVSSTN